MKVYTETATVVLLIDGNCIYLAPKKSDIHKVSGDSLEESKLTLNGYGGKRIESDGSVRDTAIRELEEESKVKASVQNLIPVAHISFHWKGDIGSAPDMDVYFFLLATYEGIPQETDEIGAPYTFKIDAIPYERMMKADALFLPRILKGEKVVGNIYFSHKNKEGNVLFVEREEEMNV